MRKSLIVIIISCLMGQIGLMSWDSVKNIEEMDTHKMIAEQGVYILQNDLSGDLSTEFMESLFKLKQNIIDLKKGSVWPDYNPDEYDMNQDHFYDPDTGLNYSLGYIPDTAESQTRKHVAIAISKWKSGDYKAAAFELGTAIHFFSDLNEPHHAANQLGGKFTAHTEFEHWVGSVKYEYKINTTGYATNQPFYINSVNNFRYISDFLTYQSNMGAYAAKSLVGLAQMSSSWDDWRYVAKQRLADVQKAVALVYYRFLMEVIKEENSIEPDSIGKFHVVFKVADEYEAGTNDDVYFGMELSDGRKVEFECNVPGNDFYRNLRWGYEFNITDPGFKAADVKKVWLRKHDHVWLGDDLKLEYFQVFMKCKNVLTVEVNDWLGTGGTLESDVIYQIDVDGLYY